MKLFHNAVKAQNNGSRLFLRVQSSIKDDMKNSILKDHFLKPVNMGKIDNPTYSSICKSDTCSDIVRMMVIIDENEKIADIKTEVYGCGYSIAGTSFFNEFAMDKKVSEILENILKIIDTLLVDIPEQNQTCIKLPLKAFKAIYDDYTRHK